MDTEDYGTIWVCVCCMITHANGGPCCEDTDDAHTPARDAQGRFTGDTILGDGYPLSRIRPPFSVAMGMGNEEHKCIEHIEDDPDCEVGTCECERPDECDCETDTYSTSQCDGCGSWLHGKRHAMWLHKVKRTRRPRKPQTAVCDTSNAPADATPSGTPNGPQTAAHDLTTVPGVLRACYSAALGKEL